MPKAIFTVGCSASGKSTWATEYSSNSQKITAIIERDSARRNILRDRGEYEKGNLWLKWNFKNENLVNEVVAVWQDQYVRQGFDIIFSDTWLNQDRLKAKIKEMQDLGYETEVKYFPVDDVDVLIKRDKKRLEGVGESVIRNQWKQWLALGPEITGIKQYKHKGGRPFCIVVDIDGTVADMGTHRGPFEWEKVHLDSPRLEVISVVESLYKSADVIFLSGRDSVCREKTYEWIRQWIDVPEFHLYMRKEGDMRKDRIIKDELFWEHVAPYYDVLFAIDDRKQMVQYWTDIGVTLLNVGNCYDDF